MKSHGSPNTTKLTYSSGHQDFCMAASWDVLQNTESGRETELPAQYLAYKHEEYALFYLKKVVGLVNDLNGNIASDVLSKLELLQQQIDSLERTSYNTVKEMASYVVLARETLSLQKLQMLDYTLKCQELLEKQKKIDELQNELATERKLHQDEVARLTANSDRLTQLLQNERNENAKLRHFLAESDNELGTLAMREEWIDDQK